MATGADVLLELGLVSQAEREVFYARAREEDLNMSVYCVDAPRDVRRRRVAQRNASGDDYVQIVPAEFFERASDAWEAPSEVERSLVSMIDI